MKRILTLAAVLTVFTGCVAKQSKCGETEEFQTCSVEKIDASAKDISGIYEAKINCDGCEKGSKSILLLENGGKFKLENNYVKKIGQREVQNGKYKIKNGVVTTVNQYRERAEYIYENGDLRRLEKKDGFIRDGFGAKIYKFVAPLSPKE